MACDSPLMKLRRVRSRIHARLKQLEPMVARYHEKLAEVEAAMRAIDPDVKMAPRFHPPNPHFAKGELPRIVRAIMREANGPLATKEVALLALARRGVTEPDKRLLTQTRKVVATLFSQWGKRGMVAKVGSGKDGKRVLATP